MTIGGWILFGLLVVCYLGAALFVIFVAETQRTGTVIALLSAAALTFVSYNGLQWYFTSTARGQRAVKTQESNLNNGIERTVEVYDAVGNLLRSYSGRFDIDYDENRIIFDDENNKRHVIYYPTGTVIVDEAE